MYGNCIMEAPVQSSHWCRMDVRECRPLVGQCGPLPLHLLQPQLVCLDLRGRSWREPGPPRASRFPLPVADRHPAHGAAPHVRHSVARLDTINAVVIATDLHPMGLPAGCSPLRGERCAGWLMLRVEGRGWLRWAHPHHVNEWHVAVLPP